MSARARLLAFWQRKRCAVNISSQVRSYCGQAMKWPFGLKLSFYTNRSKTKNYLEAFLFEQFMTGSQIIRMAKLKKKSASVSQRLNGTETKNYTANVNSTNSTYNQSHMHKCDIHDMNKKSSARMKATVVKKKCGFVCCLCVSVCE